MLNQDIQISQNILNNFQKAEEGVYADTPTNRKLGRVGQKYNSEPKLIEQEQPKHSDTDIKFEDLPIGKTQNVIYYRKIDKKPLEEILGHIEKMKDRAHFVSSEYGFAAQVYPGNIEQFKIRKYE